MTWDQLYGSQPGAPIEPAPDPLNAQLVTFRVRRTAPPAAPLTAPFPIYAIHADNLTARWWRVNGRFIPPWAVGAVIPIEPPSAQLTVEAVTPAGQLSEAVGDELVIDAISARQPLAPGLYAGPRGGWSQVHNGRAATITTSGGPPALVVVQQAPPVGQRFGLTRLRVRLRWDTQNMTHPTDLLLGWPDGVGGMVTVAGATVTADAPNPAELTFDPPALWPSTAELIASGLPLNGTVHRNMVMIGRQAAAASWGEIYVDVSYVLVVD